MATIRKRLNKYQVQVRTQGQHLSKSFNNLQDAKRWSVFNENKILLGTELQALSKKLLLKDLINKYIDEVTILKKGHVVETQRLQRLLKEPMIKQKVNIFLIWLVQFVHDAEFFGLFEAMNAPLRV